MSGKHRKPTTHRVRNTTLAASAFAALATVGMVGSQSAAATQTSGHTGAIALAADKSAVAQDVAVPGAPVIPGLPQVPPVIQNMLVPAAAPVSPAAPAPAARAAADVADPVPAPMQLIGSGSAGAPAQAAPAPAATSYGDNLEGWINQALDIMHQHGIPGSYDGIYRNVMRESSGNPRAINLYDVNAQNGIPSKGLLQVIDPTFNAYHVDGTSWDIYDPVANITAACNYAAARYGSMDNVNSAY
ncbi:transglycosylase SLT domain-containing protein [Nocardia stercoris]|uniref:Transglycosylase SLT domain-containing protein n=1 Tax=Nocardia stercoris TaxID=2483361 RepID=A0A3M2LG58_9NOCA|nr:transglycosylase SLT domain-containing protein [Nocardia stercoris]RMI34935.1 hypothetical protein EBN03_00780 [Nocardia stercoris]